ncbi:hypothetical protein ONE63_004569 [Megalurothrips usitatus]|uniref:Uncharacterized protein n=1 Tax=Megalurothrips usitatus TaxID=439358 RepID=A0AAV7X5I4_9NEOP|nr:hypothetical protein ONE63_004569 [Megalurothrips usitatus]
MPICGLLCDLELLGGWPLCFYVFGALGVLWYVPWHLCVFDSPSQHPRIDSRERQHIEKALGKVPAKVSGPTPVRNIRKYLWEVWGLFFSGNGLSFYKNPLSPQCMPEQNTYFRSLVHVRAPISMLLKINIFCSFMRYCSFYESLLRPLLSFGETPKIEVPSSNPTARVRFPARSDRVITTWRPPADLRGNPFTRIVAGVLQSDTNKNKSVAPRNGLLAARAAGRGSRGQGRSHWSHRPPAAGRCGRGARPCLPSPACPAGRPNGPAISTPISLPSRTCAYLLRARGGCSTLYPARKRSASPFLCGAPVALCCRRSPASAPPRRARGAGKPDEKICNARHPHAPKTFADTATFLKIYFRSTRTEVPP